jgi:hypothetical protein
MNSVRITTCAFLGLVLLASGCQQQTKPVISPSPKPVKEPSREEIDAKNLKQCQEELNALQSVKPREYADLKKRLDTLMGSAAQYSNLRARVANDTQVTVDALYRYKVNLLCSTVNQALLNGLAEKGEAAK